MSTVVDDIISTVVVFLLMISLVWLGYFLSRSVLNYQRFSSLFFFNEIWVEFDNRIKILRTDNALEYTKSFMHDFCVERGIVHQTSCLGTFPKMELLNISFAIFWMLIVRYCFNMLVPKMYWADAVLTATYLINRMPSPILCNKSPFPLLYPNAKPFRKTPCVFGCIAFVHLLGLGRDKLSPRAVKCLVVSPLSISA